MRSGLPDGLPDLYYKLRKRSNLYNRDHHVHDLGPLCEISFVLSA